MTRKRLKEIGIVLATGALASVLMTGSVVDFVRSDSGFVSTAYADEDGGGGGHKGKGGQGAQMGGERKGRGGEGQRGGGGKALTDILSEDEGEDSDRPDWAQQPGREGKPGGGSAGSDTKKGGDYGDLWVILRNDDGSAVMVDGYPVVVLNDGTTTYALAQSDGELPAELASMVSEVEFGRLNIARSPSKVIDHALSEALSKLDGVVITAATLEAVTDPSGRLVAPDGSTIDSPLENLAIYYEKMGDSDKAIAFIRHAQHIRLMSR